MRLREDGTGRYQADESESTCATSSAMRGGGKHIDRSITLSSGDDRRRSSRRLGRSNYFNIECASKAKNIANTGKKTLSYSGA